MILKLVGAVGLSLGSCACWDAGAVPLLCPKAQGCSHAGDRFPISPLS